MSREKLKYIFLVQGEGRGHLTQAIALSTILHNAGHEVEHVFVGSNSNRVIPKFFHDRIKAEKIELISSPGFVVDKERKAIRIWPTLIRGLINLPHYIKSCLKLDKVVQRTKPDIILNFYDPLGGLYNFIFRPAVTFICVGHQYLAHHQDFKFAPGRINRWLFQLNNRLTAIGASKQLALSFSPQSQPKNSRLEILPPLLRADIKKYDSQTKDYLLVYLLNDGYSDEIIKWHLHHRDVKIHCFWDNRNTNDRHSIHPNLTFHQLNDQKFIQYMAGCKGYVSTAGFESVCEAMYLDKPVMVVPVKGHYEQSCNAIDVLRAGSAISSKTFDLSKFMLFLEDCQLKHDDFRNWVSQGEYQFLRALELKAEKREIRKDKHLDQPRIALPQHAH